MLIYILLRHISLNDLEEYCKNRNYKIVDMRGDGNCAYYLYCFWRNISYENCHKMRR